MNGGWLCGGRLSGGRLCGGRLSGGRLCRGRLSGGWLCGGRLSSGQLCGGRLSGVLASAGWLSGWCWFGPWFVQLVDEASCTGYPMILQHLYTYYMYMQNKHALHNVYFCYKPECINLCNLCTWHLSSSPGYPHLY